MSAVMRGGLRLALAGVRGAKWRSLLTMLGVIVGIVAVVTVVGIGEGVKRQIAGTLDHFGKDLIIVRPPQAQLHDSPKQIVQTDVLFGLTNSNYLSAMDADAIKRTAGVGLSSPLGIVPGVTKVDDSAERTVLVLSTSADLAKLLKQDVQYGSMWPHEDEEANFAVLGPQAAEQLFKEPVPLGKSFTFRGQSFQVRGVFAPFKAAPFSPTANFDHAVFIPYKTAARLTNNAANMYAVLAKPTQPDGLADAITNIKQQLGAMHGGQQDFAVMQSSDSLKNGNSVLSLLTMWITAVAVISLLMGGVGIMNIMLLVVAERMHEIGVRKAIGATSRQILGQFVLEAAVVSLVGGVIGIVLSVGAIGLLSVYTDLKPVISWQAIALAAGVSIGIGIIFGAIPAIKAARKDPIEALRHE